MLTPKRIAELRKDGLHLYPKNNLTDRELESLLDTAERERELRKAIESAIRDMWNKFIHTSGPHPAIPIYESLCDALDKTKVANHDTDNA